MNTPLNPSFTVLARLAAASLMTAGLIAGTVAPPALAHPRGVIDYVALGDSYSAGVGAGVFLDTCGRTDMGYPSLLDRKRSIKLVANVACSGATTADVHSKGTEPFLRPQVRSITRKTDLVTITIGANNLGLGPIAAGCVQAPVSVNCQTAIEEVTNTIRTDLSHDLKKAFKAIKGRSKGAQVVVLGYPKLFSPEFSQLGPATATAVQLNSAVTSLNHVIKSTARYYRFQYVDVTGEFRGHGIGSPDPWINLPAANSNQSFHPTAEGYKKGYLRAFQSEVQLNRIHKFHSYN